MDPNFTIIQRISITEFRKKFSKFMRDSEAEIIILRNGKEICAFLGINAYNKYRILVNNPPSMKEES